MKTAEDFTPPLDLEKWSKIKHLGPQKRDVLIDEIKRLNALIEARDAAIRSEVEAKYAPLVEALKELLDAHSQVWFSYSFDDGRREYIDEDCRKAKAALDSLGEK